MRLGSNRIIERDCLRIERDIALAVGCVCRGWDAHASGQPERDNWRRAGLEWVRAIAAHHSQHRMPTLDMRTTHVHHATCISASSIILVYAVLPSVYWRCGVCSIRVAKSYYLRYTLGLRTYLPKFFWRNVFMHDPWRIACQQDCKYARFSDKQERYHHSSLELRHTPMAFCYCSVLQLLTYTRTRYHQDRSTSIQYTENGILLEQKE